MEGDGQREFSHMAKDLEQSKTLYMTDAWDKNNRDRLMINCSSGLESVKWLLYNLRQICSLFF